VKQRWISIFTQGLRARDGAAAPAASAAQGLTSHHPMPALAGVDYPEDVAGGLAEVNRLSWCSWSEPGQLNVTIMVADAPAHNTPQSGAKYHHFDRTNAFAKHVDVWTDPDKNIEQKLWMKTGRGKHEWRLVSFADYPDACDATAQPAPALFSSSVHSFHCTRALSSSFVHSSDCTRALFSLRLHSPPHPCTLLTAPVHSSHCTRALFSLWCVCVCAVCVAGATSSRG
jgi:hypothetical protein